MKQELKVGESIEFKVTVSEQMRPVYEGEPVENLYSTPSLVYHVELAARKLLRPYLDKNEEAVGWHVDTSHLMMAVPGMQITFNAKVKKIQGNKITSLVEAYHARGKITRSTITHAIVDRSWLHEKINEMSLIRNVAQGVLAEEIK